MFVRRTLFLLTACAALLLAGEARADVPPLPEITNCNGMKSGETCEVGGAVGHCVTDRCSRLDYSNGTPPKMAHYSCMRCEPGAAPEPVPEVNAPAETKVEEKVLVEEKASVEEKAPTPEPATSKGACSIGDPASAAPLALVILVALRRRRRPAT